MPKPKRYPDNWSEIALSVKENAGWRCAKCRQQCLRPGKQSGLTKSERCALTLAVHHRNRIPEDNRPENLIALCTACHLSYHNRGQSNVSPGQLSLFPDDDIDWDMMDCSLESAIENIKEY
ncbi:HNH endonuclease [Microcoleus sp. AT9_B5]